MCFSNLIRGVVFKRRKLFTFCEENGIILMVENIDIKKKG